jgi:hypothetical protein
VTHAAASFNRSHAFHEGIDACLSTEARIFAKTNIQPLELKCLDEQFCTIHDDLTYYMRNMTEWGDRMTRPCIFQHDEKTKKSNEFCLPPMLVQELAYILTPKESTINDPHTCGFYFFPYEVVREYVSAFEGFYVNSFDIKWHASSYLANAPSFPQFDYSPLEESSGTQREYPFDGPFPFAHPI